MQIHEITLKNKTVNEGLIGAVADVAGRSIMQKYGGQQGQFAGPQASADTAQAVSTELNQPLVDQLSKSLMQTYKNDIKSLIMKSRDPKTQAAATDASQLSDQELSLPLQRAIAKSLQFDYLQLPNRVDANAFNGKGKGTADLITKTITQYIAQIAALEKQGGYTAKQQQFKIFPLLAAQIASAQSMSRFQANSPTTKVANPRIQQILAKSQRGQELTPDETRIFQQALKSGELNVSAA
jgi:hypothetical protein